MLFRSNDTATTEIYTRPYTLSLHDALPIPIGVLASRPGDTTYEEILIQQEQKAVSDRGPGDIAKLLMSGDTWKIG